MRRAREETGAFDPDALRAELGIPEDFVPIGVMPVGRPLPDVRSPSLKRGWVPFEEFARFDRWTSDSPSPLPGPEPTPR